MNLIFTNKEKPLKRNERTKKAITTRETSNIKSVCLLVYEYKILSTEQIERLIGKSQSTVQRILRRMWDARYLDRMYPAIKLFGSQPAFHILDKQGISLLKREGIANFRGLPSPNISNMFIQHSYAISEFRILMSKAIHGQSWSIPIWRSEQEIKTDYDRVQIPSKNKEKGEKGKKNVALVPDGYFGIRVPHKETAYFFLELDRGTMQQNRFQEKIQAYHEYYESKAFKRRYGVEGFRVLTVVANDSDSQLRVKNLVKVSSQVQGIGRRFWFCHLTSINAANVLFEPIWYIAGAEGQYRLFDP